MYVVLARLICFIPSESNQHLTSAELKHGFDVPKSHIPIIPFLRTWPKAGDSQNGVGLLRDGEKHDGRD